MDSLDELAAEYDRSGELLSELRRTFADPADARRWIEAPNPAFDHQSPRSVILSGQAQKVVSRLYALNAGIPA